MKRFALPILAALLLVGSAFAAEWTIDPMHSTVGFSVKHMMVAVVHGSFTKYTTTVDYDDENPSKSTFEAIIDASSITTGVDRRDAHLRSADFFDVDKYPSMTFKSKNVEALGDGKLKVTGFLTIHGITKEVVLSGEGFTPRFKGMGTDSVAAAHAEATINRFDYDLKWNKAVETGGMIVASDVKIELDFELHKRS